MSYSLSLDEYIESALRMEIALRERLRAEGKCDYCHRPRGSSPPCRYPIRHKGETQ